MAGGIVRELVTLWGFDIDKKPLQELDAGINTVKASLKAVGIATAATAGAIGFLLNRAGGEEQTLIAFETMLGDIEKAKKLLGDIKQFADVTPFDTEEVVQVGKKLLAFGIEEDKIIEKTERLGNIASGVGKDKFPSLILAFGKIKTKGKATMEELNILLEAGVPILDELAKNMGVTKQEMFKLVQTGKVGFSDVDKAIETLSTGTGKFAGLMAKQSKSLFGLISTIKGQLDNFAKDIGKELLPMAKELVSAFLEWFNANRAIIKSKAIEFVRNLVGFFQNLIGLIMTFSKALNGLVGIFGGWNSVLNTTFKIFTAIMGLGLLTGIGLITKALFGLVLAWKAMGAAALWAQIKMALIPLAIGAIVTAIALIAEDILAFSQGRDSVFGRMIQGVTEIFSQLEQKFQTFGKIGKFLVAALLTPIRIIINAFKSLMAIIDVIRGKLSVMEGLKKIGGNIMSNLGFGTTDSLKGALGLAGNVDAATAMATQNNNPIAGLGTPFADANGANKAVNVQADNTINLNVTGMNPDDAKDLVAGTLQDQLGGMLRDTVRDGESQVER